MHYFLETEFTQLPWSGAVELISIGIVNENGEEFYACVNDFDESNCSEFVQESVLPKLPKKQNRASSDMAKSDILSFVTNHGDKISNFWCLYPTKKELRNWGLKETNTSKFCKTMVILTYSYSSTYLVMSTEIRGQARVQTLFRLLKSLRKSTSYLRTWKYTMR